MIVRRFVALSFTLVLVCSAVLSAAESGPTPTPEPVLISAEAADPPECILRMIEIAEAEWQEFGGQELPRSNKYTQWLNNAEWGWCAGFTAWCAMQAGVPQESLAAVLQRPEGESEPVFSCSAVSPGKLLRAFQYMHRTTMIPQKGFFVLYGDRTNYCTHLGLICDVQTLGNGKFRLTTIEGNIHNAVRMFIADYEPVDVYYEQYPMPAVSNLSAVPENERDSEDTEARSFRLRVSNRDGSDWYVTCFLMTWIP